MGPFELRLERFRIASENLREARKAMISTTALSSVAASRDAPKLFGPGGLMEEPTYNGVPIRSAESL